MQRRTLVTCLGDTEASAKMDGTAPYVQLQSAVQRCLRTALGVDTAASNVVALVSCGKKKKNYRTAAENLYESPIFRRSLQVAKSIADTVYILSAKHGLVPLTKKLSPYDVALTSLDKARRLRWAQLVVDDLAPALGPDTVVVAFAGEAYTTHLRAELSRRGNALLEPLAKMNLGTRGSALKRFSRVETRSTMLARLYAEFERKFASGSIVALPTLLERDDVPRRGLYVFFDPSERTIFSSAVPRIVRIGTHGVSKGSQSTLRHRLRTHMGTGELAGNHRSSVFRLHVGQALLTAQQRNLKSWAKGQSAESAIRTRENWLEKQVSNYLRKLLVFVLEVDDASGPSSFRARLERALITLITEGGLVLDLPTESWLGLHSPKKEIAGSGLWNIQHHSQDLDQRSINRFIRMLETSEQRLLL